jgi:hypothetical protein
MADQILHKDKLREKFASAAKTHGEIEALELVSRHFCIDAHVLAKVVIARPAKARNLNILKVSSVCAE